MPHLTSTTAATSPIAATTAAAAAGSSVASSSSKRREDRSTSTSKSSRVSSSTSPAPSSSSRNSARLSVRSAPRPSRGASLLPSPQQRQQQQSTTAFQRREDGGEEALHSSPTTSKRTTTTATASPRNRASTSSRGTSLVGGGVQKQQPISSLLDLDPLPVVVVGLSSKSSLGNGGSSNKRSKLRLPLSPTRTDLADKDRRGEERGESHSLPSHGGGHHFEKKYSSTVSSSSKKGQQRARSISDPPHKSDTVVAAASAADVAAAASPASATRSSPSPSMSSRASSSLRSNRRSKARTPSGGSASASLSHRYTHSPKVATTSSSPLSPPPSSSTRPPTAVIVTGMDTAAAAAVSSSSPVSTPAAAAASTLHTNNKTISTVGRFIDILNEKQELLNILKQQKSDSLQHVESRSTMSPIHSTALRQHHYHHAATANIDNNASSENDMEGSVSLLDDSTLADLSRYIDAIQTREDGSSIMLDDYDNNDDAPGMALMSTVGSSCFSENLGKLSSPRAAAASNRDRGSAGISSHKKRSNKSDSSSSHRFEDTLAVVQDFIDSKKQKQQQEQVDITAVQSKSFNEGDVDNVEPAALAAVSSFLDALVNVREARRSATTSSGNDDHHCNHNNRSVVDANENNNTRHEAVRSRKLILVNTGPATAAAGHKIVLVNTGPSRTRDSGDEKTAATEEVSVTDNDNSTAAGAGACDPNSSKGTITNSSSGSSRDHSKNRASGGSSSSSCRGGTTTSSRASASSQQPRSRTNGTSATTTSHLSSNQEPTNATPATPPTPLGSVNEMTVGVSNSSHRGGATTSSRASASSRRGSNAHRITSSEPTKTPTTPSSHKTTAASQQSNNQHPIKPPATLDLVEDTTPGIPSVNLVGSSDVVSLLGSLASTPRRSREEERLYKQLLKLRAKADRRRRDDGHSFSTEDLRPETLAMIEAYIAHIQVSGSASQDAEDDIKVPAETSNEISEFIDLLTAKKEDKQHQQQQQQQQHAHIQVSGSASQDAGDDIKVPVETSNEISDFIDLLTAKKEGKQHQQQKHVNAPVSIRVKKDPPSAFELELEKEKAVVKVARDPPIKDTLSAEFERYVSGNREPEINPAKREPPTCTRNMKDEDDTHSGQLVDSESLVVVVSGDLLRLNGTNGDSGTLATQASTVVKASETNRDWETLTTQGSTFSRSSRRENLGNARASRGNSTTPVDPEIIELLSDDDFSTSSTDANSGLREDDNHVITDTLELSTCASSSNNANFLSSEGHSARSQKRFAKERDNGTDSANVKRHVQTKPSANSSLGFESPLKAKSRSQPPSPEAKHRIRSPPVSPGRSNQVSQDEEKKIEDQPVEEDPLLENEVFLRLSEALKIQINDINQKTALAVVARNAFPHFKAFPPTPAKLYEIRVEAGEVGLSSQVASSFIQLAQAQLKNRLDGASPRDHLEAKARNYLNDDSVAHDADFIAFLCRVLKMAPIEESSSTSGPSRASSPSQQSSVLEAFEVDLEHGLLEEKHSADSEDEGPWWEAAAKLTSKSWKYYANASEDESDQDVVSDSERSSSSDQRRSCRRMRQGKKTPQTLALADLSESRSDYTSAGENMIAPMYSPNRPMSNRSDADEEMNYFWHSRQEKRERRLQFRNRNGKSYVKLPDLNTASFSRTTMEESSLPSNRRLRAGASYESEEEAWLVKRSMARWGRNTPWNAPNILFPRSKETVYPVQDPKPINGVDSAKSLYAASTIWKSRRPSGLGCQWYQSYGIRTQGHKGFFDIDLFSLYEASVTRARRHPQDKVAWEYRHVKQRFLYEQSVSFCRNWFGDLDEKHAGPIIRFPICRPKSMEMPMKAPEWSPEWYRGPYLAPLGSNLSGASFQEAIPGYLRDELEEYDQEAWEETPECGTFRNTKPQLKCGERITLVTPDLISSLRRSRWRKKYFPKGTFPY